MSETSGSAESALPNILILPDGNRRWAQENGVSFPDAYDRGAARIVECTRHLGMAGLHQTWFGIARPFNFERTEKEVLAVLDACLRIQDIGRQDGDPFNVTVEGDLSLMPPAYRQEFELQQADYEPDGVTANLLIGWSSDTEAASFARRARDFPGETVSEQMLRSSAVSEAIGYLVRTGIDTPQGQGGRVSGMIPLHSLQAEMHFESTLFPDFTSEHLDAALADYATRTHRDKLSL